MTKTDILFTPFRLKHLTLKNRFVQSAHEPSYGEGGLPKARYAAYLEEKAKGGVALVMFGGSAMVSAAWAPSFGQLNLADDAIVPAFQALAERIHRHGAATITQISHPGRRSRFDSRNWIAPVAPGPIREPEHRAPPKLIERHEMAMIRADFGAAAKRCLDGGLDGVEVAFQAGQLINNFLSKDTNTRTDEYGGPLENRLRFGLEALAEIREKVGERFVVGIRMVGDELTDNGMDQQECLEAAIAIAESGLCDYISVVAGRAGDLGLGPAIIPNMAFGSAPWLYLPSAIRARVAIPVIQAQKIADPVTAARAVADGHVDLVGMNRAFLADPHFVAKLRDGRADDIRLCVGANYCIDRIYVGGDALCIQNPATGRELTLPHVIARAESRRRAVVVGGGPAGMEAARVLSTRGHAVTLFEKTGRLGGQINLAAKATWRSPLAQIAAWLESQIRRNKVDIRLERSPAADEILADAPDCVVLATGGEPFRLAVPGAEHLLTTWDVLAGRAEPSGAVLVYDEHGGHQALSTAEVIARRGADVEFATPYRVAGIELGGTNFPTHLRELSKAGAVISTDLRLVRVYREGNRLVAALRHEFSLIEEERVVDAIVVENGVLPDASLYDGLKPLSVNLGAIDYEAIRSNARQEIVLNQHGRFRLVRVGDAVASRNIHAALYDSLRLLKDV
ncbi:MAG: FAD-dependent oxidoreductase [Methylobacteriaceae bacterium]|nr:FAD-dependent oxidoreductase [Methylobacteriaceae bacterium]